MQLTAKMSGTKTDKEMEIYCGRVLLGRVYIWCNSVQWEDYTNNRTEYNLCTIEDNGTIDSEIKPV